MTEETFAEIVAVLSASHGLSLSAEDQKAWFAILEPLPDEAAKAAALEVARTHVYATVKPADIWTKVRGASAQATLEDEAILARSEFLAEFSDWESVNYGPVGNAVVREMGGIEEIGRRIVEGDKWWARDFERLYIAFRRGGVPKHLAEPIRPKVVQQQLDDYAAGRWRVPDVLPHGEVRDATGLIALQSGNAKALPEKIS